MNTDGDWVVQPGFFSFYTPDHSPISLELIDEQGEDQTLYYGFDWKPRLTLPGRVDEPFVEGVVTVSAGTYDNPGVKRSTAMVAVVGLLPYENIKPMVNELAVAKPNNRYDGTERFGFVDKTGTLIIPAEFERADDFSEERAVIVKNGNYGVIDNTGKLLFHSAWR